MTLVLAWSGGKDAALALGELQAGPDVELVELLTTITEEYDRSTMHGVRRSLYDRQADAIGLPIRYVELPAGRSNETYEARMRAVLSTYRDRGLDAVAFADIHLEDVRAHREELLSRTPIDGSFPLWGRETGSVVADILDTGIRAIVVCVDGDRLDDTFVGREFDRDFLDALPDDVDPCGEDGSFHTFVYDAPGFSGPLPIRRGDRVTRELGDGIFHYCDLTLVE